MENEKTFVRRTGKIITTGFKYIGEDINNSDSLEERLLQTEAYLNSKVSIEVHRRFGIAVRFHI